MKAPTSGQGDGWVVSFVSNHNGERPYERVHEPAVEGVRDFARHVQHPDHPLHGDPTRAGTFDVGSGVVGFVDRRLSRSAPPEALAKEQKPGLEHKHHHVPGPPY
jgi:hypothetical protein